MIAQATTIESERLILIPLSASFLEACLTNSLEAASKQIGLTIPPEWLESRWLIQLRLDQLRQDQALEPWLLRAVGLRQERMMIGHIGFHTLPGADYLLDIAPGGVEIGYTIFPPFRRQGYATEACDALMAWANQEHHVTRFVLSISPNNVPSLGIAQHFGFRKVGTQIDEEDGPEDIFVREIETAA